MNGSEVAQPSPSAGFSGAFNRFVLPGLAFKAVVIGGGYATGRELAEFFLPSGPLGGLYGLVWAMVIWSGVAAVSFAFAFATSSRDYDTFFRNLLGPLSPLCELVYVATLVLVLSVFGATAGAIGATLFGLPSWLGALLLGLGIAAAVGAGEGAVEGLFRYVSVFLYTIYALTLALCLWRFAPRIGHALSLPVPPSGWLEGGATYASYNLLAAVAILPVLRHLTSRRDAVIAGLAAGPLAMVPAIGFYLCMTAFYPEIGAAKLPSDDLLTHLGLPVVRFAFQAMIFSAILEGGAASVNSINARVAKLFSLRAWRFDGVRRLALAAAVLVLTMSVADRIGLVALIAQGYRVIAVAFLALYIAPLLTIGLWRLARPQVRAAAAT